jgi:uncharacterized protein YjbI with pentapeptide repeats
MPDSPTSESKPACRKAAGQYPSCAGELLYEHEDEQYCVLHLPKQGKGAAFDQELRRKLENKDFNFLRVWFPEAVSFSGIDFGEEANFFEATFSGAADFTNGKFRARANFSGATFSAKAVFEGAVFSAVGEEPDKAFPFQPLIPVVDFRKATFSSSADFNQAKFSGTASFSQSVFGSPGDKKWADEVPEWARVTDRTNFASTTFSAPVDFWSATFNIETALGATFAKVSFGRANFNSNVSFEKAHFSGETDFKGAVFRADKKASFRDTKFPVGVDFSNAEFTGEASFIWAQFGVETPETGVDGKNKAEEEEEPRISFVSATFGKVEFQSCYFNESVNFTSATFNAPTKFWVARFRANAVFDSATFKGETTFDCPFKAKASFTDATFHQSVTFTGTQEQEVREKIAGKLWTITTEPMFTRKSSLSLRLVRLEKPACLLFRSVTLRPHWFVDIDARTVDFTNVRWEWGITNKEIQDIENRGIASPHRLLAIACQRLAVNAEENQRYDEASKFRHMWSDAHRREEFRGFTPWTLSWWYWLASGYGERALQALLVLLGIWILFGLLYTRVGFVQWEPKMASEPDAVAAKRDQIGAPLEFRRALAYSAGIMTLQKPEPHPATTLAEAIVFLETILGPVQGALLALAIRRKFMR